MNNFSLLFSSVSSVILLLCSCTEQPTTLTYESGVEASAKMLTRGSMVYTVGACGFCHESGIKNLSSSDFFTQFRTGLRKEGGELTYKHAGGEWLSDIDLLSVYAYIKNRQAETVQSGEIKEESPLRVEKFVPSVQATYGKVYGKYLVDHVARCGSCHSTPETFWSSEKYSMGSDRARGISALGWSEEQFFHFLSTGEKPDNTKIIERSCPVEYYAAAQEGELRAISQYISSVQSIKVE